jgi:hypothetical protein
MRHTGWRLALLAGLVWMAGSAAATPYWIDWEGNDWPENQGWTRSWGNWNGQHQGPGAYRTLEDGILTYDSLYDDGVYDFYHMFRPGEIDPAPAPGQVFVMSWRLRVEQVIGYADPSVGVSSDDAWLLAFEFGFDRMYSVFENYLPIPFAPGVFHEFEVLSTDMRSYDLRIDGDLVRHGAFQPNIGPSEIAWGEGIQGAASLHHWDRVTFGVTPDPCGLVLLAFLGACCGRKHNSTSSRPAVRTGHSAHAGAALVGLVAPCSLPTAQVGRDRAVAVPELVSRERNCS